jgi:hypothetical protein
MNRKSVMFALVLLLFGASSGAASQPATAQTIHIAASALTPPLFSAAQSGCFVAGLNGKNEAPQSGSDATGIAAFVLAPTDPTTTTRKLDYYISFTTNTLGTQTDAHIYKGAPGVSGTEVAPLSVGNPVSGTVSLTSTADLQAGSLYVNIHTTAKPDGEIRGQILPGGGCFTSSLSGRQETPPNTGIATGAGIFLLAPPDPLTTTQQLLYHIAYTNTSSLTVGAHIHRGARGVAGPILHSLPTTNPITGTVSLTAQEISDLVAGLLYVNIHTGLVQAGEIRGQIEPQATCYTATLAGANETPPNSSAATGSGVLRLTPTSATTRTLSYVISYSSTLTPTLGHIHKAAPGVAGNVVIPFKLSNPISGTLALNNQQVIDLVSGLYYVNLHSAIFTQGEIRGQVVPVGCASEYLPLSRR